jgi:hypothetical protein
MELWMYVSIYNIRLNPYILIAVIIQGSFHL